MIYEDNRDFYFVLNQYAEGRLCDIVCLSKSDGSLYIATAVDVSTLTFAPVVNVDLLNTKIALLDTYLNHFDNINTTQT